MKIYIGVHEEGDAPLNLTIRETSRGQDVSTLSLMPGDGQEVDVPDGHQMILAPGVPGTASPPAPNDDAPTDAAAVETTASTDTLTGGQGDDQSGAAPVGEDSLTGGQGDDTLSGAATEAGNDTLLGGQGDETFPGADTLVGGQVEDTLVGDSTGENTEAGGQGDDSIAGTDSQAGAAGDDAPAELKEATEADLRTVVADLMDDASEADKTSAGLISVSALNAKLAEYGFAPVTAEKRDAVHAAIAEQT